MTKRGADTSRAAMQRDVALRSTTSASFEQVVEVPLDPLAQHEAVVAGEAAGVVAGPENQVVSLGDHDQFLVFFH